MENIVFTFQVLVSPTHSMLATIYGSALAEQQSVASTIIEAA
jgi:hypothetical protein